MEIKRINSYDDERFRPEILKQHGCFLVDGQYPCEFEIIAEDTAAVRFHDYEKVDELIEEFRFYTEHITRFVDGDGRLLREFAPVNRFPIKIRDIQPSQFYVDSSKVEALQDMFSTEQDFVIPLKKIDGEHVSLDGHTRLRIAIEKGLDTITGFYTEDDADYIKRFVKDAKERKIFSPYDLQKISHEEYNVLWHQYCDTVFGR